MVQDRFVKYFADSFMKSKHSTQYVAGKSKFEALVILISLLLGFLMATGFFRRNHRSPRLLNMFMLGAYVSLPNLISNALGRLNSLGERAEDQVTYLTIWSTILLIGHACADSMNAAELNNNEEYKKYILQILILASLLGWVIFVNYQDFNFCLIFIVSILWGNIILKVEERARAFWYASKPGMAHITQVLADLMMYEHKLSKEDEVDPTTLKGYKYLVELKYVKYKVEAPWYLTNVDTTNAVTIDKIWEYQHHDKRDLINSKGDPEGKIKDLCLSMSLFWLLLRRFGGYTLYESVLASEKTWRFVHQGLLNDRDARSKRVFRVIEVELKFLHDFLYTKYYASYYGAWQFPKRICQMVIMITFSVFYIWVTHFLYEISQNNIITWVVLAIFTMIEVWQVFVLFFSDWCNVRWICWYVQNDISKERKGWLWAKLIRFVCLYGSRKEWSRNLGQYSLFDSHDLDPWICCLARKLLGNLVNLPRAGQHGNKWIKLSDEIQEALITSLRKYDEDFQNSSNDSCIWRTHANRLTAYCNLETRAHVIMVWHIATSYCMMSYGGDRKLAPTHLTEFKVAKELSLYCAYLVAIAPKLLPESEQITISVFDELIKEANKELKADSCIWCLLGRLIFKPCHCKDEEKFGKMERLAARDNQYDTNITRGVRLGQKLKDIFKDHDEDLWKLLAGFWADMLLFLAADPKTDPIAHGEYLAKGGELITHMWALLTHAGINGHHRKYVSDPPKTPLIAMQKIDIES